MAPKKIKVVDVINDIEDIPERVETDIKAIENTDTIDEEQPAIENDIKAIKNLDSLDARKESNDMIGELDEPEQRKTRPLILKLLRWLNALIVKRK